MMMFAPSVAEIYPHGFSTFVDVREVTEVLEGAARPGHFQGVATVVCKLFNITKLNTVFNISPSVEEAVRLFKAPIN